jgi:hypothetical protein
MKTEEEIRARLGMLREAQEHKALFTLDIDGKGIVVDSAINELEWVLENEV